jgi:tRNA C32,U32 (ribose-2'-O)-methylase TrmJ
MACVLTFSISGVPLQLALWVGNEFAGLSDLAISEADMQLFIPMRGMIQSLNLSVATAVCLSEIARQRAMSQDPDVYLLDEDQRKKMAMSLSLKRRGFKDAQGQPEKDAQRAARLERTWNSVVERDRSNKLARSSGAHAGEEATASE